MGVPLQAILNAAIGYCVGSVSFSLLLARSRGVDLRKVGSGNLGATNAGRNLGRKYGFAVYFLDALKGWLPTWLALTLLGDEEAWPDSLWPAVAAGAGAYAGHVWPLYHGFRGGKAVATLSGVMLALDPLAGLLAGVFWALPVLVTRYMALGSMVFGLALPLAVYLLDRDGALAERQPILIFTAIAGPFLLYTHRSNLGRLLNGTEDKLGSKKDEEPA